MDTTKTNRRHACKIGREEWAHNKLIMDIAQKTVSPELGTSMFHVRHFVRDGVSARGSLPGGGRT